MKKVLLGTSALALAGAFASPADAVEWEVRVGGFMTQYVAYADNDVDNVPFDTGTDGDLDGLFSGGDFDGVDNKSNTEIIFMPSITLDNGLQFGANVQLEGNTSGDQIDESYMYIDGSFGRVLLGSENSAGYLMTYGAPTAGTGAAGVNSSSLTAFVPFSGTGVGADVFRGTLGSSFIETLRNNDVNRITYFTPRFAGFQVGVSYARDALQDSNTQVDCDTTVCDFVDIGANYVNSFGDFSVALSGRYGFASVPGPDPEVWAAGLNLGYGGFTIGGSYAESDKDHGVQEGEFWDAGVSYETGPWAFAFAVSRGENFDDDCLALDTSAADDGGGPGDPFFGGCMGDMDETLWQYSVGANYTLAQGVTLGAFGAYVDFEGATFGGGNRAPGQNVEAEVDGWVLGTKVSISF